jgi:hypothetical protein
MAVRCLALNIDMERARSSLSPVCFLDNEIGGLLLVSRGAGAYFSIIQTFYEEERSVMSFRSLAALISPEPWRKGNNFPTCESFSPRCSSSRPNLKLVLPEKMAKEIFLERPAGTHLQPVLQLS